MLIRQIIQGINVFFLFYLFIYASFLFISVLVGASTLYEKRYKDKLKNSLLENFYVPISIIVPSFNEEITVIDTVESLLGLDYQLYEIIVVDDGSTDQTSQVLIDHFKMETEIRPILRRVKCKKEEFVYVKQIDNVLLTLIRKKNGGKSDSLNMGINASRYSYFVCMDADSILQSNSLKEIIKPVLENNDVVAVGGLVQVSNDLEFKENNVVKYRMPKNLWAAMQTLEYNRSFLASRILFDKFNSSLIISGAFGLFKKDVVVQAGGYETDTIGEDMELVIKLHVYCREHFMPYQIKYAYDAICWTQAPESLKDLFSQRKRWHIGLFQSIYKYKHIFLNVKYGFVSFLSFMYFLFYELLSPYIEIIGTLTILLSMFIGLVNYRAMITFLLTYALFGTIMSVIIYFVRLYTQHNQFKLKELLKAFLLCFIELSFLRYALSYIRATAFIGYTNKKTKWTSLERKKIDAK